MTTNAAMLSTPALILTVGSSIASAVADVEHIFLQSDQRRKVTTCFLQLNFSTGKPELTQVRRVDSIKRPGNTSREKVLEAACNGANTIQARLRSALHELRSHEKLIEVGMGGKSMLPLDVMVIADLAESDAASLETLMPMIDSLLADEPYAKVHLLLSAAVFSGDPSAGANVDAGLQSLRINLEDTERSTIPQVYLFDRYKEGVWEARDAGELQVILGNFLLALLLGGLAQRLAYQVTQLDVEERRAFFCGASATLLVFDVAQLQKACAMRLGAGILEAEFNSQIIPDPAPVEELSRDFIENHADPQAWTGRLCRDTLFHSCGDVEVELHFSSLGFDDMPMEDWGKTILAYEAAFREKQMTVQTDLIGRNMGELNVELLEQIARFVHSLPQQVRLYPGGVRASLMILERIQKKFPQVPALASDPAGIENVWDARISASLQALDQAVQALPKPPRWVDRLPVFLKKPVIQLFNLIFLYRELKILTDMRQDSVRLVERKYEALTGEILVRKLTEARQGWMTALERHKKSLQRLQALLNKLQKQFGARMVELTAPASMFRLSALDESALKWAYYYGKRPQDGFRHSLLTEHSFLSEWQKLNIKSLEETLEKFCAEVYLPLSDVDLEDVLHHREGQEAESLALSLIQGAVPMLRPNFDQTGSGSSYQMRFFMSKDTLSSSLFPVFKEDEQEWEFINTGDALLAACCRVRMLIPFSVLNHLFERGKNAGTKA